MLKIIMGTENVDKYLPTGLKFVLTTNERFNSVKKAKWFEDDFVKKVIRDIDKAEVELGFAVRSLETGDGYSVNDLSGGAKYLILMYELRNSGLVFRTTMGGNCTDLMEQLVKIYEQEGKDLYMVTNYFYDWNYDNIKEVYYVNWDVAVHNKSEAYNKAFEPWFEYEQAHKIDWIDDDEEDEEE